ncbi:metal-sensing transcriptional repressor [Stutzerimonas tarimensis]|uniref:Metal-sensing transcriptional repressor n=1 Tax=Stutzerimonas tarimensis TaxID=1507735 RepID=A0ABV7T8H0_9GAMM
MKVPLDGQQAQAQQRDAMLKRLARVEGQIRGIQAMIRREEDCEAIAQQFSAARKALDRAYQEMLVCLVEETVLSPQSDSQETMARVRAIFTKYT